MTDSMDPDRVQERVQAILREMRETSHLFQRRMTERAAEILHGEDPEAVLDLQGLAKKIRLAAKDFGLDADDAERAGRAILGLFHEFVRLKATSGKLSTSGALEVFDLLDIFGGGVAAAGKVSDSD